MPQVSGHFQKIENINVCKGPIEGKIVTKPNVWFYKKIENKNVTFTRGK